MNVELQKLESTVPGADAQEIIADAVRTILEAAGEDPNREGLRDTPKRVARMYQEIFAGLFEDPKHHLETQFSEERHEETVIVKDITFYSLCEHHLVPFHGKAHVAYIPTEGRLTGLSKVARVVHTLARKPQLQERLTSEVVKAFEDVLKPKGVMAVVQAEHMCMAMRGVKTPHSSTITIVARGEFETNAALKAETLKLLFG